MTVSGRVLAQGNFLITDPQTFQQYVVEDDLVPALEQRLLGKGQQQLVPLRRRLTPLGHRAEEPGRNPSPMSGSLTSRNGISELTPYLTR